MNSLTFQKATRQGSSNKQERHYLDFIISGQSLRTIIGIDKNDLISPFGWGDNKNYEKDIINILTFRKKPDLETGRVILYVCPECGDIDCGAITMTIEDLGNKIAWKDFGYETSYGGVSDQFELEPIEIERQAYFQAFSSLK